MLGTVSRGPGSPWRGVQAESRRKGKPGPEGVYGDEECLGHRKSYGQLRTSQNFWVRIEAWPSTPTEPESIGAGLGHCGF